MAPTQGAFTGREHRLAVRVYYEDTDFTGLVYHANYLRYFERGRSDYLRVAGIGHAALLERADPMAFVVTRMEIDFRAPARIDDALEVRTTYRSVRGPRLFIDQAIWRDETLLCQAKVEAASINLDGRPRRPPKDMIAKLTPLFDAEH